MPRPTTLLAAAALTLAGTAGALTATSIASASTLKLAPSSASSPTITIGSTNFPEQVIVANLYSDVLQHAGFKTNVRADLGTRTAVEPALAHGSLDLYPDYAGSLLVFLEPKDTAQATQLSTDLPALKAALAPQGATVLTPAPATDVNVFAVTKATAAKYHLTTLSSLAPVAPKLSFGALPSAPPTPIACSAWRRCTASISSPSSPPMRPGPSPWPTSKTGRSTWPSSSPATAPSPRTASSS